jgi:hypothetical protein
VQVLPSVRMTANLNAVVRFQTSVAEAAAAVAGPDVAHHVVDPGGLVGLDPLRATPLADALGAVAAQELELWVLALPVPGSPGPLRGPAELNQAALEAGQVVLAGSGGLALVPHLVGAGVQWRVHRAERPAAPPSSYEAERAARLLQACDHALDHDGSAISSYEAEVRARELRRLRTAAGDALCAATSWMVR